MYDKLATLLGTTTEELVSSIDEIKWVGPAEIKTDDQVRDEYREMYARLEERLAALPDHVFENFVRMAVETHGDCVGFPPELRAAMASAPADDPWSLVYAYYGVPDDEELWHDLELGELMIQYRGYPEGDSGA